MLSQIFVWFVIFHCVLNGRALFPLQTNDTLNDAIMIALEKKLLSLTFTGSKPIHFWYNCSKQLNFWVRRMEPVSRWWKRAIGDHTDLLKARVSLVLALCYIRVTYNTLYPITLFLFWRNEFIFFSILIVLCKGRSTSMFSFCWIWPAWCPDTFCDV